MKREIGQLQGSKGAWDKELNIKRKAPHSERNRDIALVIPSVQNLLGTSVSVAASCSI